MNRESAFFFVVAFALLVAGVSMWSVPAAVITAGVLSAGAGVAMLETDDRTGQ